MHRDLKPANIMVTAGEQVKVLDFGLAKAFSNEAEGAVPANSPALSLAMTQAGLILGTAGYMSPEQASGQATDQRADIWAFGVVLYEMLSGLPLFSGESVPHILADVLRSSPDWSRLPEGVHPRLKLLLERCLEKKVRDRYHSIADARVDIEKILGDPQGTVAGSQAAVVVARRSIALPVAASFILTLIGCVLLAYTAWRLWPVPERPLTRFSIDLEAPLGSFQPLALSPDGRRIVYALDGRLYSQRLDQREATVISATEDATDPFFAPDSESVAFFTATALKSAGFTGDAPRVLANIEGAPGVVGDWDERGRIFFGQAGSFGMLQVPSIGGVPAPFIELGEYADIDFPDVLPAGEWVLVSALVASGNWSESDILAKNSVTGEQKLVLESGHFARYVATGHLLFVRDGTLYAVAFDPVAVEVTGAPVPVVQNIASDETGGHAKYAVAMDGTLIYVPGVVTERLGEAAVVQADHDGNSTVLTSELRNYNGPRVSPDGARLAIEATDDIGDVHIWIMDLETGSAAQLTFDGSVNRHPVWTPDGQTILFVSNRNEEFAIYSKAADGTGQAARILAGTRQLVSTEVLQGNILVYQDLGGGNDRDILTYDLDAGEAAALFLATPSDEYGARISPDGTWMVYVSDESGRDRIYIRPYPAADGGQRVVPEGAGSAPVWSADGDSLYFISPPPGNLMAATVARSGTTVVPGRARESFIFVSRFRVAGLEDTAPYDVVPDGGGVYATQIAGLIESRDAVPSYGRPRINVVLNWFEDLQRLVPIE